MIRLAEMQDVPAILAIFDQARDFMRANGNPTQQPASYPNRQLVERDIQTGTCYVCEEAGQIVGTFALIIGDRNRTRLNSSHLSSSRIPSYA